MNKELAVEVSGLVKVYHDGDHPVPVSYTHLTLPTNSRV